MARPGIYKDGKKWRIVTKVTINGESIHIHRRGFESEADAYYEKTRIIHELNVQAKLGHYSSFGQLVSSYFEYVKNQFKPSYIYRSQLVVEKHFGHFYNEKLITVCGYKFLENVVNDIGSKKVSTDYKNKLLRQLKAILNYGANRGLLDNASLSNVTLLLIAFKDNEIKTRKIIPILTKDEYSAFLEAIPQYSRDRVLFTLWGQTGLRIGEIRALTPKHIDRINKQIIINQQAVTKLGIGRTIITSPKTKKSIRNIDVSSKMIAQLDEFISALEIGQDDFIFYGASKKIPLSENSIRAAQKKYSKLAGVEYIKPHGIRHSNTTWLLSNVDTLEEVGEVSERLGHSSKKVTLDIYFHTIKKRNNDLLKVVDF